MTALVISFFIVVGLFMFGIHLSSYNMKEIEEAGIDPLIVFGWMMITGSASVVLYILVMIFYIASFV